MARNDGKSDSHIHSSAPDRPGDTAGHAPLVFPEDDVCASLLGYLKDLVTVVGSDGHITYENPAVTSILGYDHGERVGFLFDQYLHEDYADFWERVVAGETMTPDDSPIMLRMRHADGSWRNLEARVSRCFHDPMVEGVILTCRDASDRIRAAESLARSEERYHELFTYSPAAIFTLAPDRTILEINATVVESLGFGVDEIVGRILDDLLAPEFAGIFKERWQIILEGNSVPAAEFQFISREGTRRSFYAREGRRHRVFLRGHVESVTIELMDVTEQRAVEDRERVQREELYQAAKLATMGTLLSGVAHEINNPNNYIRMNIDSMRNFWRDAERVLEEISGKGRAVSLGGIPFHRARGMVGTAMEGISEGADRIAALVRDLTDYAKTGNTGKRMVTDVRSAMETALSIVGSTIRHYTSNFVTTLHDGPVLVVGEKHRLEQVCMNLITNACLALTDRSQRIAVFVGLNRDAKWAEIRVEDEGKGMSKDVVLHSTDPFFTTRRGEGGTGLGLAVTQRIVSDYNGSLSFDSVPGAGTVATVRFPIVEAGDE